MVHDYFHIMIKFIVFLALILFTFPAASQSLKFGSEIGYAHVKLKQSKNIALFTSAGIGLEIPVNKGWFLEIAPSFSNFYFNNYTPDDHAQYLTIRSIELSTYLRYFVWVSTKSYVYMSLAPNAVYYYQFKTEDYGADIQTSAKWSNFCFGIGGEIGLRTHVFRRFWFDVGLIDRRDWVTPSVEDDQYIKSVRQALKLSAYITLGKNSDHPKKVITVPKYDPNY